MRALIIPALFLAAAACSSQQMTAGEADTATACIDVSGAQAIVKCVKHESTLLGGDEGFCTCPTPARQVKASPCAPGESPPAETSAYRAAVREAAKDGSLIGDTFEGQPMCIEPGRT
ncbi:MAG TPA: hypothetical protein VG983_10300 [Caulobacterales bacterium]|jgi:hypothetical protein|nr:hypothetical protein [Caulobacterales bacterium]